MFKNYFTTALRNFSANPVDALRGIGITGVSCVQDRVWTLNPNLSRREIYDLLTHSGLSPSDFYEQYFTEIGQPGEKIEVDGVPVTRE